MSTAIPSHQGHHHLHLHRHHSADTEHGYPHGHLGRLTEHELEQLAAFKALLEEKALYVPGSPPSHDDPTILRYLRARKWVPQDALQQFKETEQWRAANDIDVLYKTIDVEAYEMARKLYPQWTGRRDRRGMPIYVFEIRHLDSKAVNAYDKAANNTYSKAQWDGKTPKGLLRLFALYENLTRFTQPLASQLGDREDADVPITLSNNIVDVTGVSLKQFWNLKSHMQVASVLATAHYPETLDRIFVVGAPAFFSTVWSWIKRWFDPTTVDKIFILGHHEVKNVLTQFIDPSDIPTKYGGELEFNWGDGPTLDPTAAETIEWSEGFSDFPRGPVYWRDVGDGKTLECVAVGSVDKIERMHRVCTIKRTCPSHPRVATANAELEAKAEQSVEKVAPTSEISVAPVAVSTCVHIKDGATTSVTVAAVEKEIESLRVVSDSESDTTEARNMKEISEKMPSTTTPAAAQSQAQQVSV